MMWWGGEWGWGAWLAMSLGMLVFWGLVAWVVVTLVRQRDNAGSPPPPTPEDILSQRFARGEIEADQYRERLELLRGQGPAGMPSP
jgi:putative membrane protein